MKRILITVLATVLFAGTAAAEDYDIVINNGRVMDPETMFDAVRNVGISNGKIATITKEAIKGKDTLDAIGHVVAPGFIDTHTHSSNKFNIKMSMMDGVTSGMDFETGGLNVAHGMTGKRENGPSTSEHV
jgi:N-acyl-D-amino-acid deacylase